MFFTKKDIVVDNIVYSDGLAEVIKLKIGRGNGKREFARTYVPPVTLSWAVEEHNTMLRGHKNLFGQNVKSVQQINKQE